MDDKSAWLVVVTVGEHATLGEVDNGMRDRRHDTAECIDPTEPERVSEVVEVEVEVEWARGVGEPGGGAADAR